MNKSKKLVWIGALGITLGLGLGWSTPSLRAAESETTETKHLQALPAQSQASDKSKGSLADEAGSDFSNGGKSLGRGFVKGSRVTGHAFKKAGVTVASSFKKAGRAIHDYFTGKKEPEIQESDLGGTASQDMSSVSPKRDEASQELDAVGNDLPKKSESDRLVKRAAGADSKLD